MDRETVIRLAEEAGAMFEELPMMDAIVFSVCDSKWNSKELERFAALVAAHEREAIAKMFEECPWGYEDEIATAIRSRT